MKVDSEDFQSPSNTTIPGQAELFQLWEKWQQRSCKERKEKAFLFGCFRTPWISIYLNIEMFSTANAEL